MGVALLVSRVVLALVFGVAGLAKLADRDGTRAALADFGVPTKLAPSLGIVLPLAELVVAGTLLPTATARWGALGALALLLLFVAVIGLNLAKGRRPDCHCFGQLHSSPVGSAAVARNGAFAAVAGFVVLQGYDDSGHSLGALFADLTNAQLLGVVAGLLALAL